MSLKRLLSHHLPTQLRWRQLYFSGAVDWKNSISGYVGDGLDGHAVYQQHLTMSLDDDRLVLNSVLLSFILLIDHHLSRQKKKEKLAPV